MATKVRLYMGEKHSTPWLTVSTRTTQRIYFRGMYYTIERELQHFVHPLNHSRDFSDRTISVSYMKHEWRGWTQTRYRQVTVPAHLATPKVR